METRLVIAYSLIATIILGVAAWTVLSARLRHRRNAGNVRRRGWQRWLGMRR